MKHVSSSFRPSRFRAGGYLCIVILVALRLLACHGLLRAHLSEKHVSGGTRPPRSVAREYSFQIQSSSPSDHSRIEKSMLEKGGGISYRQSVCTPEELSAMTRELSLVMKRSLTKERSSIAQNRLGATLTADQASETIRILEEGSIFKLAQRLADSSQNGSGHRRIELAREIPVEMRLYEQVGASMAWHRDDIMYDPPQLELVFTVENNSDCVTMWKIDSKNAQNGNKEDIRSQETHPNSSLLLLAGGPEHCVTSLKRGKRVILKCAYVYEGAKYVGEEDYQQFGNAKNTRSKKASKSKKKKR